MSAARMAESRRLIEVSLSITRSRRAVRRPLPLLTGPEHERPRSQRGISWGLAPPARGIPFVTFDVVDTGDRDHHPVVRHLDELLTPQIPQRELGLVDRAAEEIGDDHERQARTVRRGAPDVVEGPEQLTTQFPLVMGASVRELSLR